MERSVGLFLFVFRLVPLSQVWYNEFDPVTGRCFVLKKVLAIFMAFVFILALAGCGQSTGEDGSSTAAPTATPEPTPEPTPTPVPIPTLETDPLTGLETAYPGSRPVGITYVSDPEARPLWGISQAELIIEGLVSGDYSTITAVFPNSEDLPKVGPVGYGQDLGLQFLIPLNAIPVHMGKSVYASNILNLLTYQDLDGILAGKSVLAYDSERKALGYPDQYCWYTDRGLVSSGLSLYGASAQGSLVSLFQFGEGKSGEQPAGQFEIIYSSGSTTRGYYDSESGKYRLEYGDGEEWTDPNLEKTASVDNVVILMSSTQTKDDGVTLDYDLSQGDAYLLHGGTALPCHFIKGSATAPLQLVDGNGAPVTVNPGTTYIGIYGVGNQSVVFS